MASSQIPANLVLGTSGCNTHMIRAENAIKNSLVPFGQRAKDASGVYGILSTSNVRMGFPLRLHNNGLKKAERIPEWAEDEKFSKSSFEIFRYSAPIKLFSVVMFLSPIQVDISNWEERSSKLFLVLVRRITMS